MIPLEGASRHFSDFSKRYLPDNNPKPKSGKEGEGAFGVVKHNYGFRQFLLRGQKKVMTEIFLLAMAYNINKLHAKIQQNRTGRQLFEKDTA